MESVKSMGLDPKMWVPVGHILRDAEKCGKVVSAAVTVTDPKWFRRQRPVLRLHFDTPTALDRFEKKVRSWSGFHCERSSTVIDVWPVKG